MYSAAIILTALISSVLAYYGRCIIFEGRNPCGDSHLNSYCKEYMEAECGRKPPHTPKNFDYDDYSKDFVNADGKASRIEKFPFMAQFEWVPEGEETPVTVCAGSIISRYDIITKSTCISDIFSERNYQVRVGSSYRKTGGSVHRVIDATHHNNLSLGPMIKLTEKPKPHDLVVLRLENPITYDSTKQPIEIAEYDKVIRNWSTAKVAGWNWKTNEGRRLGKIRSAELKMVDKKDCYKAFEWYEYNMDSKVCATPKNESMILCRGSYRRPYGEPLIVDGKLVGIGSDYYSCKDENIAYNNVFTEFDAYNLNWIYKVLEYHKQLRANDLKNHEQKNFSTSMRDEL